MNCRRILLVKGFSLIELMVSIVIGLITVLVVTQVLMTSAERKRSSVSGTDSVVNATLALYTIERDIKNAGFGLNPNRQSLGCQVKRRYASQPEENAILAPVAIGDGMNGASDTIRIMASNKTNFSLPIFIREHDETSRVFHVHHALGVEPGDIMVAVPAVPTDDAWCSVFEVSGVSDIGEGRTEIHHAAESGRPWNQSPTSIFPSGSNRYWRGDYLVNLGSGFEQTYSIQNNDLQVSSYNYFSPTDRSISQTLYPNVVQLQAVYGRDTNTDGSVDLWDATAPTESTEWEQIIAVRLAIVVQGMKREAEMVTPDPSNGIGDCNMATAVCWKPNPNGDSVPIKITGTDWRNYYYRVLETTVPLRNAIWAR